MDILLISLSSYCFLSENTEVSFSKAKKQKEGIVPYFTQHLQFIKFQYQKHIP